MWRIRRQPVTTATTIAAMEATTTATDRTPLSASASVGARVGAGDVVWCGVVWCVVVPCENAE